MMLPCEFPLFIGALLSAVIHRAGSQDSCGDHLDQGVEFSLFTDQSGTNSMELKLHCLSGSSKKEFLVQSLLPAGLSKMNEMFAGKHLDKARVYAFPRAGHYTVLVYSLRSDTTSTVYAFEISGNCDTAKYILHGQIGRHELERMHVFCQAGMFADCKAKPDDCGRPGLFFFLDNDCAFGVLGELINPAADKKESDAYSLRLNRYRWDRFHGKIVVWVYGRQYDLAGGDELIDIYGHATLTRKGDQVILRNKFQDTNARCLRQLRIKEARGFLIDYFPVMDTFMHKDANATMLSISNMRTCNTPSFQEVAEGEDLLGENFCGGESGGLKVGAVLSLVICVLLTSSFSSMCSSVRVSGKRMQNEGKAKPGLPWAENTKTEGASVMTMGVTEGASAYGDPSTMGESALGSTIKPGSKTPSSTAKPSKAGKAGKTTKTGKNAKNAKGATKGKKKK